ncbi:MAG: hypothetical protein QOG62_161 [Thermoleophilaceae bacterium]|jgi:glyoxylase-like metal-dependent hydrolase (beta-lactamase superfamily II)|nr:hypothetical protein [Thermoleophilaceae bacterium]
MSDSPPGVVQVKADNPGVFSLDGTNTYVVGGSWVVDPGPLLEDHLKAVLEVIDGKLDGIVLTHSHSDHSEAAPELSERCGGAAIHTPSDGEQVGPFTAMATPGHSADHACLLMGGVCFTGDTVLGTGSVFVQPGNGALAAYLASLRRLRALELDWLCPGHGPIVSDAPGKLDEYIAHRLDREARLLTAIDSGLRTTDDLLDAVWVDAPPALRMGAAITLAAHLEKLRDEGRLPAGVEDPLTAYPALSGIRDS